MSNFNIRNSNYFRYDYIEKQPNYNDYNKVGQYNLCSKHTDLVIFNLLIKELLWQSENEDGHRRFKFFASQVTNRNFYSYLYDLYNNRISLSEDKLIEIHEELITDLKKEL